MQRLEFDNQFDVLFNNITSNQAPGLNTYEKSVLLTKAQDEVVKNHFMPNSKGNNLQQGYDDSQKRQADFSGLMATSKSSEIVTATTYKFTCVEGVWNTDHTEIMEGRQTVLDETAIKFRSNSIDGEILPYDTFEDNEVNFVSNEGTITHEDPSTGDEIIYYVEGYPYEQGWITKETVINKDPLDHIDFRSKVYTFPSDAFILINETLEDISKKKVLQVIPLKYDEYTRLMSKPYKRPLKHQAWRLINKGNASTKWAELIAGPEYDNTSLQYVVRYVRRPKPIILGDLDGLSINGYYLEGTTEPEDIQNPLPIDGECELDPMLHEEILQRAVELAKIAWTATGQENAQLVMSAGQRSE